MTTLEVVEAVQRSLENEGFLQSIRAQLRSNVLRIISSGPDYSPQVGKAVALTKSKEGAIVLQLVRDMLEEYGLKGSLAVFEAEVGLDMQDYLSRDKLQKELNIGSVCNGSILEVLVSDALKGTGAANANRHLAAGSASSGEMAQENSHSPDLDHSHHRQDRIEDEDSSSEGGDDENINYSQIEEIDESFAASTSTSAAPSPAQLSAPAKDETCYGSVLHNPDAKAPPPTLHSSFHQHSSNKMDESSSFEADSPVRPVSSNNTATAAQQKFAATVLEDSFVEELEDDISVEEEIAEEQNEYDTELSAVRDSSKSISAPVSPHKSADEANPQFNEFSADNDGDGSEDGPEYESDHGSDAKEDSRLPVMAAASAKGDHKQFSDSDSDSDSRRSTRNVGASDSLRPAVAEDFDPLDRGASKDGISAPSHSSNRVAVRRASAEAAESKNSPDAAAPGAKASVFRLGQSSISRSQLGWGSEANNSGLDDRSEENDQDGVHSSEDERGAARGGLSRGPSAPTGGRGARYSNTNQMEAVSFDTDEDEHQPSPVRAENRRSNNQESGSDDDTLGRRNDRSGPSADDGDFEMEDGDDDGDVSFGDDDGALPSVGSGASSRRAFGPSPGNGGAEDRGAAIENNEEEYEEDEEYGDDDFVEDDEVEDEDEALGKGNKVPVEQPSSNTGGLFRSRLDAGPVPTVGRGGSHSEAEDSEHSSVEEEIEEEDDDDMSVGDAGSEEDHDFGSPTVNNRKQKASSGADAGSSGGMFRAGRSGALPGMSTGAKGSNFDSVLNSFEADSSEDDGDGGVSSFLPSTGRGTVPASSSRAPPSITSRMREIDSQLEELEQGDPHLAALRGQQHSDDDNSVASEDIDAMEFSTGGGAENDSESSGEGSFSFLDSSSKNFPPSSNCFRYAEQDQKLQAAQRKSITILRRKYIVLVPLCSPIESINMDKMLTKFESKSNRVKGLSFHPIRPWILASLHNGHIQLWDYRMGTLLDKFEEHDGPVRGVDFHRSQPLIVSGGDDYKVKVWDYKLRRCLFTLLGHLDYIRTVQFHVEYPWIVSASDDQTIRIWNWQSRHCISVLTGHNHYVMCAAFHPKEDMIVSASLDQTVRVWDTTGLRKKTVRGAPPQMDDSNVVSRVNNELFGGNDAVVKYVLEGHERGVNWASFHPTLPLVISGADDRQVKLWRMNETKAWEVDTMRGHTNNVSCVLFHPKHELIVSNSEDRTIRVWDISKRLGVQTFRRDGDRFWILAVHPEQNLLAAGHDSGMTVFKLERERPAFDTLGGKCFYVKDRYLRMHEFSSSRDVPLVSLRRTTSNATPGIGGGPRTLSYNAHNKAENNVLILSDADGGSYELLTFSTDGTGSGDAQDVRRGSGIAAVFLARDRFAVLDKGRQLLIKNFQNEVVKRTTPPIPGVDCLFFAGTSGRLLLKAEERTVMFDHQARKIIAELHIPRVKYVVWNSDYSYVALVAKHYMMIANKNFEQLCTVSETVRLKGGCWDATNSVFIYTTLNHVKYVLPNGDRGIIRGLDSPVYVTKVQGNSLFCLDREGKVRNMEIDTTEALFKLALERKDYAEVMRMVKHSRLCGQAIITYLQDKGYPEVALHFVHDSKTRFKLALACGNIQVAMNVAYDLGDDAWRQLGVEALRQGNHEVVEMSYQKTKEFDSLSFLYLLTGNTDKLRKMQKIAEMRGDAMSCVHNALYLGDAEERVKVIEATGQLALAYLTAKTHGLEDTATRLAELLESSGIAVPTVSPTATLLQPPTPIYRSENWPQLAVTQSAVSNMHGASTGTSNGVSSTAMDGDDFQDASGGGNWGDDDDLFDDEGDAGEKKTPASKAMPAAGEGWGDDDLDLSDDEAPVPTTPSKSSIETTRNADGSIFTVPNAGNPPTLAWVAESSHCADHFAAGSADSAVQLLNRQVAAVSVAPLKAGATSLFLGATAYLPGFSLAPSNRSYLLRDSGKPVAGAAAAKPFPSLTLKVTALLEQLKAAYRAFTNAQFQECQDSLDSILRSILLISVSTRTETNDLKELLDVSREYLIALRVKNAMGDAAAGDVGRGLELAAYFTHCNLQPSHLMLALKTAMASAFKNKNFINAASFARRLLELPDMNSEKNADSRSKAQKVLQKSEQQGRNEYTIDYDERNPFSLDCNNLKPLYKGTPLVKCSYCSACYAADPKGKRCLICGISTVGLDTVGLVTMSATTRTK